MYDLVARPLQFFYELWPNYAGAIALLTLSIMLILLPLTLKGTRSMLAMQKLQPELKKIQNKHRDDRQKLNEEVMKFYKENNINPMSGCLPLLLQMPVFFILYRTLYELLNRAPYGHDLGAAVARATSGANGGVYERYGYFRPKHIQESSELYKALSHTSEMKSFGINLAESAQRSLSHGFGTAAPFLLLVAAVAATSFYQQRQIAGRNPSAAQANPQQAMLMKIMPVFFAFISLTLPAGIVVYFLVSNLFRVGQQALITRTMYHEQHGAIPTTGKAVDKSSTEDSTKPKGLIEAFREIELPNPRKARESFAKGDQGANGAPGKARSGAAPPAKATKPTKSAKAATPARSGSSARPKSGPSRAQPSQANRSRAKK
jgi:YidC/Oxa1 family membrane protein insertase